MARIAKAGINFYRMDSGHIRNEKVRLLLNEFDSDGYYIWSSILDYGYLKNGYYFDCNDKDKLELFASEYCRKRLTLVQEVIAGCIRRGLFDKAVFDSFGILTCEMMQEVFMYGTYERRKKGVVFCMQEDWLLIDMEQFNSVKIEILTGILAKIPGQKGILTGKKATNRNLNETETKHKRENTVAAASPPAPVTKSVLKKVGNKKKYEPPEPHWNSLVKVWFDFNIEKFLDKNPGVNPKEGEPSFDGPDPRFLKKIIQRLHKRALVQKAEWTEVVSADRLRKFLWEAWKDDWLSKNFLLSNLDKQFDKIILELKNGTHQQTPVRNHNGKSAGAEQLLGSLKAELASFGHTGG